MTKDRSLINTILAHGNTIRHHVVDGVAEYHIEYTDVLWIVVVGPGFASALPTK
jgi:hypothetical protein